LEFKDKRILLDCGIHPGLSGKILNKRLNSLKSNFKSLMFNYILCILGVDALPFTDMIEADKIDLLLVSHFHLDHAGSLPHFLQKTTFR
jgi:cleavage and polyadenylation specificity factor subunit 3